MGEPDEHPIAEKEIDIEQKSTTDKDYLKVYKKSVKDAKCKC